MYCSSYLHKEYSGTAAVLINLSSVLHLLRHAWLCELVFFYSYGISKAILLTLHLVT